MPPANENLRAVERHNLALLHQNSRQARIIWLLGLLLAVETAILGIQLAAEAAASLQIERAEQAVNDLAPPTGFAGLLRSLGGARP